MTEVHSILMQLSPHLIVAGDFNIDLKSNSSISKEYSNLLHDFCLTQYISELNRVSHASATLIDHTSGSNLQFIPAIHSYQEVGLSDHYIQDVYFEALIYPQEARTLWIHSFRKCDWSKLRETLSYALVH